MELYEALLKQAQRKEGGEDITDDPTKAAGQGTADPQDTATRGTTNTLGTTVDYQRTTPSSFQRLCKINYYQTKGFLVLKF